MDYATSTYLITNAAKYRGNGISNKQRKAILLYLVSLLADKRSSLSYSSNLASLRSNVDNVFQGEDTMEYLLSAAIAMQLGQDVANATATVTANTTLTDLLEASKVAAAWDEEAIDRAIMVCRGRITAT